MATRPVLEGGRPLLLESRPAFSEDPCFCCEGGIIVGRCCDGTVQKTAFLTILGFVDSGIIPPECAGVCAQLNQTWVFDSDDEVSPCVFQRDITDELGVPAPPSQARRALCHNTSDFLQLEWLGLFNTATIRVAMDGVQVGGALILSVATNRNVGIGFVGPPPVNLNDPNCGSCGFETVESSVGANVGWTGGNICSNIAVSSEGCVQNA